MKYEQIEKVIVQEHFGNSEVRITFKTRKPIRGIFIKTADYNELRSKNLWRIVSESNIDFYNQSKDANLARIFNGTEITRLEVM